MPEAGDLSAHPPAPWTYTLSIPNDPRAVTICRRTLRLVLTLHGLPHLTEAAELVATELVANAVQHTKGPAAIRLRWSAPTLRIGVWDTDPRPPAPAPFATTPNLALTSGRGLTLVEECTEKWGWYAQGSGSQLHYSNGKFVWCELTEAA
ncbi:ATP-binding protein [Streptomyces sp. NBC_01381]|uniref:ATP-binding protein n=1 Tax=Streptomyces sp. NBC_01381 TaxID=2903845 RepID=UPI00225962CC|nr:ATP-binding protein [Streptomyces sp. NBC_01381]MCX4666222.1 ATP-binding protein [Streptomyces sp. NBC_01381]